MKAIALILFACYVSSSNIFSASSTFICSKDVLKIRFKVSTPSDLYRIQRRRTGRAPPCLKCFKIYFFKCLMCNTLKLYCIQLATEKLVYHYVLSLQKLRVCVKGHQSNLKTLKIIPRRNRALRFINSWIRH